jgi:hypothetical protein
MTKDEQIIEIKRIVRKNGVTTSGELNLGSSPCIGSIGNGRNNASLLVEGFYENDVTAVLYYGDQELGEECIDYKDLSEDVIDEIYNIMEGYEIDCDKTMDKCRDNNF